MAGAKIALTGVTGELQTDGSDNARVNLPLDITTSGYGLIGSIVDEGVVTGTRAAREAYITEDYRFAVGIDSQVFNLSFEGTNISRDRIQQNDTTATSAQTGGFLTLNSGASITSGQGTNIRTYKAFPIYSAASTYMDFYVKIPNATATNSIAEIGFGYISGVTAQVTDGICFRVSSSGTLYAIVAHNNNGAPLDVFSQAITTTDIPNRDQTGAFDLTEMQHFFIGWQNDQVAFWINNVLVATYYPSTAYGMPTSSSELPLFARVYNSGTASAAKQISIGYVGVTQAEINNGKPFGHIMNGMGGGAYQYQSGNVSGPTVSRGAAPNGWPTSGTVQATGTWTATTAPATNSLGGQWVSPAISTLITGTDYPVFSYLNPAGSSTVPGKTLYITGVHWGKTVAATAASTNGIRLHYIVGIGSTSSASTATEAATVIAARGMCVDTIPFKSTAVLSDYIDGGNVDVSAAPLVILPGCYISWIVRPVGTVTSNTLTVVGSVAFTGYHA